MIENLKRYAAIFRLGRPLEVTEDFIATLGLILPKVKEKEGAKLSEIQVMLNGILACQEREDWLGLADYIEYELIDLLENSNAN